MLYVQTVGMGWQEPHHQESTARAELRLEKQAETKQDTKRSLDSGLCKERPLKAFLI